MERLNGQTIKGYELNELIGEGGFGAIYRATQTAIGREVAVKIILPQHANRPEFIRRFETEAQLVARLEHPFIVPLYDYWREPSGAYLVMRWLRGGSLRNELKQKGPLSPYRVSQVLSQIGEALAVAHRQGVIHRDLKLDNIILDGDGNAFLTDFGIAKDLRRDSQITSEGAIIGSPAYLSPEQIKGEEITHHVDIYAMGIAVYQMLTGELPFDESTPAAMMYKHLAEPMPDITEKHKHISPMVNLVLQKATAKEKEDRYTDIIAFVKDYKRAIKSMPDAGEPEEAFDAIDTALNLTPTASIILPDPDNPYKGLRAFQQADSADFFGREALVNQLLERLQSDDDRLLAIVGPSGSGKSSVVKAGMLPAIARGAIPDSEEWFIVEMVPGAEPMEELEAALLRIAVNPPESLYNQLIEDKRGLLRAVKRVLPDDDSELVLFVDQFEETFTLVDEEDQRVHFLDSLLEVATDPRSRIRVILTLRADFYDKPLNYVSFGTLLREHTEVVLPLSQEELELAITGPAQRIGMTVEPALVQAIVDDVNKQPGALPLLQYALTELFERREGRVLTLKAYDDIGGTLGALARRAEELYAGLDHDGKEATRQLFLRLVALGEGTEDTRRRAFQSELMSIGDDPQQMMDAIEAFGRYRLLTFDHDPQTRSATVEIAHEALIRQWGRMRDWLTANREDLRSQRRLIAAAEEWVGASRDPSFLLRGARLIQFEEWMSNTDLALNELESEYLNASIASREAREAEERARQEREEALEQRSRNRLRALAAVLTVATIVAIGLMFVAFNQSQQAQEARTAAEENEAEARGLALAANARNALIEDNPVLALSLALEANEAFQPPPNEVMRILASSTFGPGVRHRFEGHDGAVLSADFSQDGTRGVTASADGTIKLWDNDTGELTHTIELTETGVVTSAAFCAEDELVYAGTTDGIIFAIDFESGEEVRRMDGHNGAVTSLDYNVENDILLSGSLDRTLRLWNASTGELLQTLEGHTGVVFDVALSANGEFAASSSGDETINAGIDQIEDRTVRVWEISTGEEVQQLSPPPGYARTVAFSPDNRYVLSGTWNDSDGGILTMWNIRNGRIEQQFFGHTDIITGVGFLPNGETVVSTSWDRTLRLWDVLTGIEIDRFEVFEDRLQDVSVSTNGDYLLVPTGDIGGNEISREFENSRDTSVWLIDLEGRDEVRQFTGSEDWIWTVDLSPDETIVATGSGPLSTPDDATPIDTAIRLWNIDTGEEIRRMDGHDETVEGVDFSPDGETLLSGSWDGTIILWNAETGARINTYGDRDSEINYTNVEFAPNGTQFAASTTAGVIILYDVESTDEIRRFDGHDRDVDGIVFNSDGTILASGSYDGTIRLWDVQSGDVIQIMEGHTDRVNDVRFSPDDDRLLSSSWDGTVRLWDVESGDLIRTFLGHNGQTFGIDFSPDGEYIISGSSDTTVRLWDIDTGQELRRLTGHENWISEVHFLNNGQFVISGAQDNTVRLWQVPLNPTEIRTWATNNRYVRDLSCAERDQYRVEPLCS